MFTIIFDCFYNFCFPTEFEPQYQNQTELSRTRQESIERTNSGPKRVHYAPHTQFAKQDEHDNENRSESLLLQQQKQQQTSQSQQQQQQSQRHSQNIPTSSSVQSLTNKNARLQRQSSTNAGTPTQGNISFLVYFFSIFVYNFCVVVESLFTFPSLFNRLTLPIEEKSKFVLVLFCHIKVKT